MSKDEYEVEWWATFRGTSMVEADSAREALELVIENMEGIEIQNIIEYAGDHEVLSAVIFSEGGEA